MDNSTPGSSASAGAKLRQLSQRLYLRLWLAVVASVVVLTLLFGWFWRVNTETAPMREVVIRNEDGDVLGATRALPIRVPGQGFEFQVPMADGSTLYIHLPPRQRAPGESPPPRPIARGPWGLFWMLSITALAVALGSYPIIRRLTKRLERLRAGVEQWGQGELSTRVPVEGQDEVGFLAERFNHAAERIEQLVQSHTSLLQANRSLLANASHELRSPLTRIRMGLELMGDKPSPSFKQEISRNIAELDQLIEEILLASRLDAHEADMGTVETVDLLGLAAEECARCDAVLEPPPEGEASVQGVAKLLRRLVRNLLENARRYGQGDVDVSLSVDGHQVELRVSDRGPGVPEALRQRIFEPFYRLPGASEQSGGVGLGLALVKSIAERHGGQVRCEGRDGGGASFVVRLPASTSL